MRLLAAMVAAFVCSPAIAADYLGKVLAVSDGDTFTMEADGAKVRVRICGIDAPERGQAGYGQAAGVLSSMIEGKTVHCLQVGEGTVCDGRSRPTSRDRIVAQCFLDKVDIAVRHRVRLAQILRRQVQDQRHHLLAQIGFDAVQGPFVRPPKQTRPPCAISIRSPPTRPPSSRSSGS